MQEELKLRQDNLYHEWNPETGRLDILWLLQLEDGRFYQNTKSINLKPYLKYLDD